MNDQERLAKIRKLAQKSQSGQNWISPGEVLAILNAPAAQGEADVQKEVDSALALLNKHLSGRVYTDLDDALRNLIQAFITLRDNAAEETAQGEPVMSSDGEALAKRFHEAYERLAPQFNYKTRKDSAVAWADVPANNRALMIAVCAEILNAPAAPPAAPPEEANNFVCHLCGKEYVTYEDLHLHTKDVHRKPAAPLERHKWLDNTYVNCCSCKWRCELNGTGRHQLESCKKEHAAHVASLSGKRE